MPETAHPICPRCRRPVPGRPTQYGPRHECCGLRSWNGKPLVDPAVLKAREACHEIFDRLWQGGKQHGKARRNDCYRYMAEQLGMPEPEIHMSVMTDLGLMRRFYVVARDVTPEAINTWVKGATDTDT